MSEVPWTPDRPTPDRLELPRPVWRRVIELPRAVGEFLLAALIVGVPLSVLVLLGDLFAKGTQGTFRPSAVAVPIGVSLFFLLGFTTFAAALGGGASLELDPRDGRLRVDSGARRLRARVKKGSTIKLARAGPSLVLAVRTGSLERGLPLYAPVGSAAEPSLVAFAERLAQRAGTPLERTGA